MRPLLYQYLICMKISPHRLLLIVLLFISSQLFSQRNKQHPDYSRHPYWIEMMNAEHPNYFETVKAYDEFWAHHKKPQEEDQVIGQEKSSERESFLQRFFKSKEEREEEEMEKYRLDVKKFEHWKLKVQPYVQEDGRILTADEQLKLWQEQKK
jgi:hypothetical protein